MHIRPWVHADLPVVATILAACNSTDTLSRYLNPYLDSAFTSYRRKGLNWLRGSWLDRGKQSYVLTGTPEELSRGPVNQVVTSTSASTSTSLQDQSNVATSTGAAETVVGWAQFSRKGTSEIAKTWQNAPSGTAVTLERALLAVEKFAAKFIINDDPSGDRKHWASFLGHGDDDWDEDIFAESWEVDGLFTDTKYQRRGYGGLLLEWVFERAREENVPVCVRGSPRGGPMYRKYGFRSIGEIGLGRHLHFDELEYGGEIMQMWVWEPENSDGRWWERAKEKREEQQKQRTESRDKHAENY